MERLTTEGVREAVERFPLPGELVEVHSLERGHIHDTFVSVSRASGRELRHLHQRINDEVFRDVDLLMENVHRVTRHLAEKHANGSAGGLEPLVLVPARDGAHYARTGTGAWRTFVFVEGTTSHDRCSGPQQAYDAARAFGAFQAELRDLPAGELGETLPAFFSSPHRFAQFRTALEAATEERRASASAEIAFAEERVEMVGVVDLMLREGSMPRRVVHGDTKLNNVLFDERTGKPRCIVDLDTCMPGWSLYDFGDLVRFTAATSAEDEPDAAKAGTDLELYRALAEGYLSTARAFLTPDEVRLMPFAARLVTQTIGLRFLADHLAGDVYFKIHRPGHNLDRARVQFGMVRFMEEHEAEMAVD